MSRPLTSGNDPDTTRRSEDLYERLRLIEDLLSSHSFLRGRLLDTEDTANAIVGSGLTFAAGTARSFKHGLNRKAKGFVEVCLASYPSAAYCGLRATQHPPPFSSETHITVTAASSGVCAIWVF